MPFVKRSVQPEYLCRNDVLIGGTEVLVEQNKFTMVSLIRQMSSIAEHTEDIISNLLSNLDSISRRSDNIKNRLMVVSDIVTSANFNFDASRPNETGGRQGVETRRHFQMKLQSESIGLTRDIFPVSLQKVYDSCLPPPNLQQLDQLRNDGVVSTQLYSNPKFFYEAWLTMMNKDLREKIKKKKGRIKKQEAKMVIADLPKSKKAEIVDRTAGIDLAGAKSSRAGSQVVACSALNLNLTPEKSSKSGQELSRSKKKDGGSDISGSYVVNQSQMAIPEEFPLPTDEMMDSTCNFPPPELDQSYEQSSPEKVENLANSHFPILSQAQPRLQKQLPPPLPTSTTPAPSSAAAAAAPPPPPPPPPPLSAPAPPPPMSRSGDDSAAAKKKQSPVAKPPQADPRDTLLSSIRSGTTLKKVEPVAEVQKKPEAIHGMDVASILAQRIQVMAMSDSDEDEEEADDDDWN